MTNKRLQILSTRQLSPSIIQAAANKSIDIDCIPFISTGVAPDPLLSEKINHVPSKNSWVVFTSINAVKTVAAVYLQKPYWKIGSIAEATKQEVISLFPYCEIIATAPNGALLSEKIVAENPEAVFFFCGNKRLNIIPQVLKENKIACNEIIVYETVATPERITKKYDGILFFSSSGVESFLSKNSWPQQTAAFSIGPSTTKALAPHTNLVLESGHPSSKALLQLIEIYYTTNKAE